MRSFPYKRGLSTKHPPGKIRRRFVVAEYGTLGEYCAAMGDPRLP